MTQDTSPERTPDVTETLWKEYCDGSKSIGVLPGGVEEFDIDEMNCRAWDLYEHAKSLQSKLDAARKVKDLVWRSDRGNCQQYANSLIGEIRVTVFGGSWFYKGDCFGANEVGLELAKAAAQADYERRILSALDQGGAV